MKTLDTEEQKIQKICNAIRKETLEPVQQEAGEIIKNAEIKAAEILKEAERQAEHLFKQTKEKIEQERNVFNSSLIQAARQSVEALKQSIETRVFNEMLDEEIQKVMADPRIIAKVIGALVSAVEKEGLQTDLTAVLPKTVSSKDISAHLAKNLFQMLSDNHERSGSFVGGAQLVLRDRKMTIDMTDESVKELLASFVRKDFRRLIFTDS